MFGDNRRLNAADQLLDDMPLKNKVTDTKAIRTEVNKQLEKISEQTKIVLNKKRVEAVP